ncbi:PIN domain nuclease [Salinibacterium sp.]|uniref:PIN domain nuclease n=1 Tax=Salinibacterium sp. TaxID=1915057 RepID=UPI00286B1F1C|nr:PIN domain nuclease [Salinibacterium sp.]
MTFEAIGGHLYLVDTSAFSRASSMPVAEILTALIADGLAATCITVDLEAGYSGRSADDVRAIMHTRGSLYVNLPVTEQIAERARQTQLRMAARGQHRAAGIVDLLTAAIAEHHGAVVLHYDADFEHIAAVTGQPQLWIAPRGSLD